MLSSNPSGDMDEELTRRSNDSKRLVVQQGNTGAVTGLNGYHFNMKTSKKFADYSFRTKAQEAAYEKVGSVPKGTTSIYRDDAVRFIVDNLASKQNQAS